jgi:hypothetical protein
VTSRLAFDRVVIRAGNQIRECSAEEFKRLSLVERVQHMLNGNLQFFAGSVEVERRQALESLLSAARPSEPPRARSRER